MTNFTREAPQDGVGKTGRAREARLLDERHGVVDDGRVGDTLEIQQLVRAEPQRIEYLVIQPTSDETETRAGLILPASAAAAAACRTGIVTAIGGDVTGVEPGDKVLYPRDAGYEVRLGGIEVKVVKRDDLIARIHD